MQNFLELRWLLHVIVCAVFLGFKTKISKLACYYLNAEFSGTNMVIAYYCMCCFSEFEELKSKLACYYLNECHAEFSGTNLVSACFCDVLI